MTDGRRQAGRGENRLHADRQLYPATMTERDKLAIKNQNSFGNLRKPLGTRASRPHLVEKCGQDARAPSKKGGFRRLPFVTGDLRQVGQRDKITTCRQPPALSRCPRRRGVILRRRNVCVKIHIAGRRRNFARRWDNSNTSRFCRRTYCQFRRADSARRHCRQTAQALFRRSD